MSAQFDRDVAIAQKALHRILNHAKYTPHLDFYCISLFFFTSLASEIYYEIKMDFDLVMSRIPAQNELARCSIFRPCDFPEPSG